MSEYQQMKPLDAINAIFAKLVQGDGQGRGRPKYTYNWWRIPRNWKGTTYRFGYTPWKTEYKGKLGYWAFKYRVLKNGNEKLVKAVRFGRRKIARERSWAWHSKFYATN